MVLFNAKLAIFHLHNGENKFHFDEMVLMSAARSLMTTVTHGAVTNMIDTLQ